MGRNPSPASPESAAASAAANAAADEGHAAPALDAVELALAKALELRTIAEYAAFMNEIAPWEDSS